MEVSTALLLRTPLFRGIPKEALPALLEGLGARKRRCGRGEVVLRRGERADRLGLVLSGTLHIVKEDFWGSRTIVGLARSGEVFAEAYACLGGEPLEVAVLAAADAEVLFLNSVQALSCARPGAAEFTRNLLTILAGRNLTLTRKIGHMARRTTRDKLLSYLSAQAMQAGGPEFDIPLDRQQLADYLAVDRSAMSTALGKLRDEGVLTFQKNHFHLLQQMDFGIENLNMRARSANTFTIDDLREIAQTCDPQRHVYRTWKAPGRGCADVSKKPFPPASADGAD